MDEEEEEEEEVLRCMGKEEKEDEVQEGSKRIQEIFAKVCVCACVEGR